MKAKITALKANYAALKKKIKRKFRLNCSHLRNSFISFCKAQEKEKVKDSEKKTFVVNHESCDTYSSSMLISSYFEIRKRISFPYLLFFSLHQMDEHWNGSAANGRISSFFICRIVQVKDCNVNYFRIREFISTFSQREYKIWWVVTQIT